LRERSLKQARQELVAREDLKGVDFCRALALEADRWLSAVLLEASGGDLTGIALVAVGGYGRGELAPHSDLDLVLLHNGRKDVEAIAERVWYPIWDQGVRLDHSVKRAEEALAVARSDLRAQLGLLDARAVAGDTRLARNLRESARTQWQQQARAWFDTMAQQAKERQALYGEVAFLLEPDLKESHGGLRDLNALRAVQVALGTGPDSADHTPDPAYGAALQPAYSAALRAGGLEEAGAILTAIRVELQRTSERPTDRLLLQEQDRVARALGHKDADALMGDVARSGRAIAWAVDDLWRRFRSRLGAGSTPGRGMRSSFGSRTTRRPSRRPSIALGEPGEEATRSPVEPGICFLLPARKRRRASLLRRARPTDDGRGVVAGVSIAEEVALEADADLVFDPSLALRLAAVAAEHDLPMSRASLARLAGEVPAMEGPWDPRLKEAFVRVLLAGPPAISALEALDQVGLMSRILPEWSAVRNRPQRNAYHRFTVDRHLLECASQAALLANRVERPDLLVTGALLHDIGKGFPGDHTEAGVEVVGRIAPRMGFDAEDSEVLVAMVRHHLLLPDTATRRDLDDPATIETVVRAAGSRLVLELLAALAEADGLATGPAAWGQWKAGLVADLARRAEAVFGGDASMARSPIVMEERHRELMAATRSDGRTRVVAHDQEVSVVAPDRPGLLAAVAGAMAIRGIDVRSAKIDSEDGVAVEVFVVEPSRGRWPDWSKVAQDVEAAMEGRMDLRHRLEERERTYRPARRAFVPRPSPVQVTLDNAASSRATVIEVRAEDASGLLHALASTMASLGLDIVSAKVSTLGHEVVDVFYVLGEGGTKVRDPASIRAVEAALKQAAIASGGPTPE